MDESVGKSPSCATCATNSYNIVRVSLNRTFSDLVTLITKYLGLVRNTPYIEELVAQVAVQPVSLAETRHMAYVQPNRCEVYARSG